MANLELRLIQARSRKGKRGSLGMNPPECASLLRSRPRGNRPKEPNKRNLRHHVWTSSSLVSTVFVPPSPSPHQCPASRSSSAPCTPQFLFNQLSANYGDHTRNNQTQLSIAWSSPLHFCIPQTPAPRACTFNAIQSRPRTD